MKLREVSAKFGAPMGRASTFNDPGTHPVTCHIVPMSMVDGDYDSGGAYWGNVPGEPMFHIFNKQDRDNPEGELVEHFVRAKDIDSAIVQAVADCPFPIDFAPYLGELDLDEFVDGFVKAALWSTTGTVDEEDLKNPSFEGCEVGDDYNLDDHFGPEDIHEEAMEQIRSDCEGFISECHELLLVAMNTGRPLDHLGHDFLLSKNGHGTGFWDRGLGETGDLLHKASKPYGNTELCLGCNGKLVL
jgi:hypothetical protein